MLPRKKILRDLQIEFLSPLYVNKEVTLSWEFDSYGDVCVDLTCGSNLVTKIQIGFQEPLPELDACHFPKRNRQNHPTNGLEFNAQFFSKHESKCNGLLPHIPLWLGQFQIIS